MTYSIPYSFIPGTKARAQEVNTNFNYVLDSMGDLNSTKLNASLSNITNAGIDIIKNCTAFRNIGEIISTVSPLNDAGLHLLDGTLLSGSGSYSDFVDYIADLYSGVRIFNSGAFTATGNPAITDDGIASGFSSSNYLRISNTITAPITFVNSAVLEIEFTPSSVTDTGNMDFLGSGANQGIMLRQVNSELKVFLSTNGTSWTHGNFTIYNNLVANTSYKIRVEFSTTGAKFYVNGNLVYTETGGKIYGLPWYIGVGNFSGSIDLKQFSIIIDEEEVFLGSSPLGIFTTETLWQNSVNNDGTCGMFVYNPANNTVRLPKITGIVEGRTDLIKTFYYIVVATSTQTDIQVDIDNIATDLNGKADKDLSNINPTQAIKNSIMSWGIPDYNNGITYAYTTANTEQEYTMPSKGYFAYTLVGGNSTAAYAYIKINNKEIVYGKHPVGSGHAPITGLIPVESGDNVKVRSEYTTANTALITHIEFIPLKGVN